MAKNATKKSKLAIFGLVVILLGTLIGTTIRSIISGLNLGLDLRGGFEILYQVEPLNEGSTVDMSAVINSISKRINVLGVSEPQITVEGNNRIRVQLAGASDLETAREMIGTTANLTFRDVNDVELADSSILKEGGATLAYQNGEPVVSLAIADKEKFGQMTSDISKRTNGTNIMVIWLDWEDGDTYAAEAAKARAGEESKYISAASVNSQINDDCIISGNFTEESARTLANLINSGSLPVKLTELSSNVVSASYGADALRVTALAGVLGVAVVMLVMILVYRLPGLISAIMLAFYVWAVFGIYSLMGAVFTLSGIGALVLGIGMTVDANIINYERIRQELYKGRSVRAAVAEGGKLSFGAIFDAQLTTLIAALIMYIWGTGTVKGFATMLIITVVMTLLLNVGFSKRLLNLIVDSGVCDNKPGLFAVKKNQIPNVSKGEKQFYTGTHHLDYMGKAKYAVGISSLIVIVALCLSLFNLSKGNGFFNLGIDFASGTKLTVTSENTVEVSDVQATLESLGYDDFSFQSSGDSTVYATTKASLDKQHLTEIKSAFEEKYGVEPGDNIVTPVVGAELVRSAIILTVVAWIAMLGYISFRYEFDYALGCLVALVHDVLIVLAIFSILRLEVNIELISVLLTIIGYSINNSIIVFDRVREVVRSRHNIDPSEYRTIANDAIDEAIKMSVISSITTLIPVIFLLVMGSNSIFTFVFAMLVGLIAGTVSSIFIAAYLWCIIRIHSKPKQRNKKHTKAKKEKKEALDEYTITGINA